MLAGLFDNEVDGLLRQEWLRQEWRELKGSAFLPILIAGITPLFLIGLIVTGAGLGLVAWRAPVLWQNVFQVGPYQSAASSIVADSSGAYVQGYLNYSGSGPGDQGTLFLNRYSTTGTLAWSRETGKTSDTYVYGESLGSDGIYLTGNVNSSGLVQKYDLTGNQIWTREFGSSLANNLGESISWSSTGVYVAGLSTPLTNQSFTGLVVFVREYDPNGNIVWTRELTNSSQDVGGVYGDSSGVYVGYKGALPGQSGTAATGTYLAKYDQNGSLLWTRVFGESSGALNGVAGDSSGVYAVGIGVFNFAATKSLLTKYDPNGNTVWSVQIESPDASCVCGASSVSVGSSGVYVSLATSRGGEFVQKYDLQGNHIWSLQMASPSDKVYQLASNNGLVYVAGDVHYSTVYSGALIEAVSASSSLIFFGLNPPWSFLVLGGSLSVVIVGLFYLGRTRRRRMRLSRVKPSDRSLPVRD